MAFEAIEPMIAPLVSPLENEALFVLRQVWPSVEIFVVLSSIDPIVKATAHFSCTISSEPCKDLGRVKIVIAVPNQENDASTIRWLQPVNQTNDIGLG